MRFTRGIVRGPLRTAAALALLLPAACTIRITPPIALDDPQTIYVADYGDHASLMLPRGDGRVAEFAYGEWGWFALGRDQWYRAVPAVTWPTKGTLGRREFEAPADADSLRRRVPLESLHELRVERKAVRKLIDRFDAEFEARADKQVYNARLDMHFVPHPDFYCLFCQCNSAVARWLDELGCRIRGWALLADFEIDEVGPADP